MRVYVVEIEMVSADGQPIWQTISVHGLKEEAIKAMQLHARNLSYLSSKDRPYHVRSYEVQVESGAKTLPCRHLQTEDLIDPVHGELSIWCLRCGAHSTDAINYRQPHYLPERLAEKLASEPETEAPRLTPGQAPATRPAIRL